VTYLNSLGPYPEREEQYQAMESSQRIAFDKVGPGFGAIEAIGQFIDHCPTGCIFRIQTAEVGTLTFEATPAKDDSFKQKLQERRDERAQSLKELDRSKLTYLKTNLDRQLFYAELIIKDSEQLIFSPRRFIFDNIQSGSWTDEGDYGYFSAPADAGTYYVSYRDREDHTWRDRDTPDHLSFEAVHDAREFGITSTGISAVYRELRTKYEQKEVALPLIGLSVKPGVLIAYSLVIAIGLAAWASFLLRNARQNIPTDKDVPWILFEPFRQFTSTASRLEYPVAAMELILFLLFHLIAFTAPVLVWVAMVMTRSIDNSWVTVVAAIPAFLFSLSMLLNYGFIVRNVIKARQGNAISNADS
jgi:hypothetical protein